MIFEVTTDGTPEIVARNLMRSGRQAVNTEPLLALLIKDVLRINELQFTSQGRRGGGSWKGLKDDTKQRKGHSRILYGSTHQLINSVTELGAPHQILNISPDGFILGTTREGARTHQMGYPKRNIPARPFLRILPGDTTRWSRMLIEHLMEPLR